MIYCKLESGQRRLPSLIDQSIIVLDVLLELALLSEQYAQPVKLWATHTVPVAMSELAKMS